MATFNWVKFCDYAYYSDHNKLSIINMAATGLLIRATVLPITHPQLFVVMETTVTPADKQLDFSAQIRAPSGKVMQRVEEPSIFAMDIADHISIFPFYGMRLEEEGEYHLEIFANLDSIVQYPFWVEVKPM